MANPLRLFPTEDDTIEGTGRALREGRRTCRDVLESCLASIEEWEPKVRAWVVVDREGARRQARRLDDELAAGAYRGPLHGIPIGIKDIVDVAGLATACGAKHWAKGLAEADAPLVAKLRQAGAVILGKTVTTPYAWVDPPVTRNPWNLDHTPGGSSSGSAAAVATGMCLGAIGTQTGGSITRPASFCGVAGHKPNFLEVETEGILPFAPSLDHPGPLARSVLDLTYLQSVIGRFSRLAQPTADPPGEKTMWPGRPPKIGCLGGAFRELAVPVMREAIDEAVGVFIMNGAEVVKAPLPVDHEEVIATHRVIMASEAAAFHQQRLREMPGDYPPRIAELIAEGLQISAVDYLQRKQLGKALGQEVLTVLKDVDVLLTPAALGPAPDPTTTGNPAFNSPWSLWGLATVTFPVGLSPDGLPLGVQLVGTDRSLFSAALWCEDVIRRAYESRSD